MSKIVSFKGQLGINTQEKINLRTIKGKIGYKIVKFDIISETPGTNNIELIGQVFKKEQVSILSVVNFDDSDLLAAAFHVTQYGPTQATIFDNQIVNQNVFVTMTDQSGNSVPGNYYIEFEAISLSDVEATRATLQSIRTIASKNE
jgi:hypothetical protein